MEEIPCPDGYLLDAKSPLADGHRVLNQYLVRVEESGWQTALKELNAIKDQDRKLLTWKALLERLRWLHAHYLGSACLSPLRGLGERIEKWTLSPTESDLNDILDRTAEVAGVVAPYTPVPHLMRYVERNGLTPALAAGIRRFRERVWDRSYRVNQVSLQMFRSRMDMLAWRDEWNPIDLKRCWSEQIRADFRCMQGVERENWRRLLYSIHGDEGPKPGPQWLADTENVIRSIGVGAFRVALLRWFEPLQRGRAQRLSREGSYILRSFIWLAQATADLELLAKTSHICGVDFKPKSNGEKVIRAAAEATGGPNPAVKPPTNAPTTLDSVTARALAAVLSPANVPAKLCGRVRIANEIVHVRGSLEAYTVHISTGAIFRVRDGKQMRIDCTAAQVEAYTVPDLGGVAELLRTILILADDAHHAAALNISPE